MIQPQHISLLDDIYYRQDYASLYLNKGEELFYFKYQYDGDFFINLAIKRPILEVSGIIIDGTWYDMETPYGYGGLYTNSFDRDFLNKAQIAYISRCQEENIIAEFIRFHPFNLFPVKNANFFDFIIKDRAVVIVDLSVSKDERWQQYSKNTRNILRKCERLLKVKNNDLDLISFQEIYYNTMVKNKAENFYFFDIKYFKKLQEITGVKLVTIQLENQTISAGFFMYGNQIAYYHLSANSTQYLKYNANYLLLETAFQNARQLGCQFMMLGGGRSNASDDSLFKFKKKFSKQNLPFYIAGKIYQPEIYKKLNKLWQQQNHGNNLKYFLKYRV